MTDLDLEALGRRVRDAQDEVLHDPATRRRARARIVNTSAAPREPKRFGVLLGAAVVAGAALLFFTTQDRGDDAPLVARINTRVVAVDAPLEAPSSQATRVDLSDGSSFALAPGSAARLRAIDARGARFALTRGEAEIEVIHRDATRFAIEAGRYTLHVIGTRFAARYDEARDTLAVQMREGRVRIEGPFGDVFASGTEWIEVGPEGPREQATVTATTIAPVVPGPGPVIEARAEVHSETDEIGEAGEAGEAEAGEAGRAGETHSAVRADERVARPSAVAALEDPPAGGRSRARSFEDRRRAFRRAMERGDYTVALSHLRQADRERVRATGNAQALLRLATAERRAGLASAQVTLTRIRSRFPTSGPAADALFLLARRSFQAHRYAAAADGFAGYLREAPEGRHRRDAAGRLIEARRAAGQSSGAARAAERYLSRYPDGPHQNVAREVLSR